MRLRNIIREGASAILTTTIKDLDGNALAPADLDSLTLTLRDEPTRSIINERDDQDVLNANGGELTPEGAFSLRLDPDDTIVVNDALTLEWHEALLTWVWTDDLIEYTGKAVLKHKVLNEDPTLSTSSCGCHSHPFWWMRRGWC